MTDLRVETIRFLVEPLPDYDAWRGWIVQYPVMRPYELTSFPTSATPVSGSKRVSTEGLHTFALIA